MMPPHLPQAFLTTPIAHRGYHNKAAGRPENSLSAFRAAISAGYGIELDVQQSLDHQAMVFHDNTLPRLTNAEGAVAALTAAELGRVALKDSATDHIPTLQEVLDLVSGKVPLLIEIKANLDSMLPTAGDLEQAVARALAGYQGPVAVMSFNPHCVAEIARLAPDLPRGLTTEAYDPEQNAPIPPEVCARLREIPDYDSTGSCFISHQASDLGRARVSALRAQGAAILCWTIRSPSEEDAARKIAQNVTFEGYPAVIPR